MVQHWYGVNNPASKQVRTTGKFFQTKHFDGAIADFDRAIQADPASDVRIDWTRVGIVAFILVLAIAPILTSGIVRTYAWIFILRTEGLLNTLLLQLHLIQAPLDLLYSNEAVLLGLVYGYLPFMVLPLYAAIERIDPALIEAAWDLYADRWSLFRLVLVPLTKPGIVAGCVLVFIPSLGAFLTPDLLGGARSMMVGNLIQHEYLVARDWPLGSALSLVMMLMVTGSIVWYLRAQTPRDGERGAG